MRGTLHEVFGAGVFAIEHPEKANDAVAMYTAGVEAALRVYEVLLKAKPESSMPFLNDLVAKRDHGELGAYVAKVAKKKCK